MSRSVYLVECNDGVRYYDVVAAYDSRAKAVARVKREEAKAQRWHEEMVQTDYRSRLPIPLGCMGDLSVKRLPLR